MQIVHKTADTYSKADGTINHAPSETDLKKVVSTTNVVPENTRHHFRERSREALAAFSLNKLYRSIFELHEKEFFSRTFWGWLKYSILIVATVVGDQLMDVPGLLGSLVRKHFRERLHMPKKVVRFRKRKSRYLNHAKTTLSYSDGPCTVRKARVAARERHNGHLRTKPGRSRV